MFRGTPCMRTHQTPLVLFLGAANVISSNPANIFFKNPPRGWDDFWWWNDKMEMKRQVFSYLFTQKQFFSQLTKQNHPWPDSRKCILLLPGNNQLWLGGSKLHSKLIFFILYYLVLCSWIKIWTMRKISSVFFLKLC